MHFAFDKIRFQNNQYLVTVIAKHRLQDIMYLLNEHQIKFALITVDWFALHSDELAVSESVLLVNKGDFKGTLSGELAVYYLKTNPLNEPLLFNDSQISYDTKLNKINTNSHQWIAERLLNSTPLNLCQGSFQHGKGTDSIKKKYSLVGALISVWLLSILLPAHHAGLATFAVMAATIAALTFLYGLIVTVLTHTLAERLRANPRFGRVLTRVAGTFMIGFGASSRCRAERNAAAASRVRPRAGRLRGRGACRAWRRGRRCRPGARDARRAQVGDAIEGEPAESIHLRQGPARAALDERALATQPSRVDPVEHRGEQMQSFFAVYGKRPRSLSASAARTSPVSSAVSRSAAWRGVSSTWMPPLGRSQ